VDRWTRRDGGGDGKGRERGGYVVVAEMWLKIMLSKNPAPVSMTRKKYL
jgi:hypothetical protein